MRKTIAFTSAKIELACTIVGRYLTEHYRGSQTGYAMALREPPPAIFAPGRLQTYKAFAEAARLSGESAVAAMRRMQDTLRGPDPVGFQRQGLADYSPHYMNTPQLSAYVLRCRAARWGNCELQALEAALHLHAIGVPVFVESNTEISHNYAVVRYDGEKEALVDPWAGRFFVHKVTDKLKYKRKSGKEWASFSAWLREVDEIAMLIPALVKALSDAGLIVLEELMRYNLQRAFRRPQGLGLYPDKP